jgi:hypothetical protein
VVGIPRAFLSVSLAIGIAVGVTVIWEFGPPSPGFVERLFFPAGTVVMYAGYYLPVEFVVPPAGGVLVGAANVDHTSLGLGWCRAGQCAISCGFEPPNPTYGGPAWSYSVHARLSPGQYYWGPRCSSFGNATFTQPLELVTA